MVAMAFYRTENHLSPNTSVATVFILQTQLPILLFGDHLHCIH